MNTAETLYPIEIFSIKIRPVIADFTLKILEKLDLNSLGPDLLILGEVVKRGSADRLTFEPQVLNSRSRSSAQEQYVKAKGHGYWHLPNEDRSKFVLLDILQLTPDGNKLSNEVKSVLKIIEHANSIKLDSCPYLNRHNIPSAYMRDSFIKEMNLLEGFEPPPTPIPSEQETIEDRLFIPSKPVVWEHETFDPTIKTTPFPLEDVIVEGKAVTVTVLPAEESEIYRQLLQETQKLNTEATQILTRYHRYLTRGSKIGIKLTK